MKAVLLEVSHWHFPLYIKDLLDGGIEVVGFSDKSEEIRAKYSKLFRCEGYNDWKETLGSCSYDVAVHLHISPRTQRPTRTLPGTALSKRLSELLLNVARIVGCSIMVVAHSAISPLHSKSTAVSLRLAALMP